MAEKNKDMFGNYFLETFPNHSLDSKADENFRIHKNQPLTNVVNPKEDILLIKRDSDSF